LVNYQIIGTELGVYATDNAFTSASYPIDTTYRAADTTIIIADTTITPADTTFSPADTVYVVADTNYVIADTSYIMSDTIVRLDTATTVDSSYIATRTQVDSSFVPPVIIVLDSVLRVDTTVIIFVVDTTFIAADTTYIAADTTYIPADTTYIPIIIVSTTPADTMYVAGSITIIPADTTITTRPNVVWTEENTDLGRAPVMAVKQMTFGWEEGATNQGKIYIGTHGRGIYEADQLVGIDDNNNNDHNSESKAGKNKLTIYPNPAVNQINIEFSSTSNSLVNVQLFNLNGQIVREIQPTNLQKGENTFKFNVEELNNGIYIIRTLVDGVASTGKFIKQ
jgi:hypothetical protein